MKIIIFILILSSTVFGGTISKTVPGFAPEYHCLDTTITYRGGYVITEICNNCIVYDTYPPMIDCEVDSIFIDTTAKNQWVVDTIRREPIPKQPLRIKIDTVEIGRVIHDSTRFLNGYKRVIDYYYKLDTTYYLTPEQVKLLEGMK